MALWQELMAKWEKEDSVDIDNDPFNRTTILVMKRIPILSIPRVKILLTCMDRGGNNPAAFFFRCNTSNFYSCVFLSFVLYLYHQIEEVSIMYVMILTLSARFLATCRALAAELPQVHISTDQVQKLEFLPHVTEEEVRHLAESYITSGNYDKVEIIRR